MKLSDKILGLFVVFVFAMGYGAGRIDARRGIEDTKSAEYKRGVEDMRDLCISATEQLAICRANEQQESPNE